MTPPFCSLSKDLANIDTVSIARLLLASQEWPGPRTQNRGSTASSKQDLLNNADVLHSVFPVYSCIESFKIKSLEKRVFYNELNVFICVCLLAKCWTQFYVTKCSSASKRASIVFCGMCLLLKLEALFGGHCLLYTIDVRVVEPIWHVVEEREVWSTHSLFPFPELCIEAVTSTKRYMKIWI